MTQLSAQSIKALCDPTNTAPVGGTSSPQHTPLIKPFSEERMVINGKSAGLSAASYDCRIDHDLVLGVNPAHIIADHILSHGFANQAILRAKLLNNPPMAALAYTMEDFCFPNNVTGAVCDKSTYARVFVSAFNTFFDPGFHGNATLELVNLGQEPVTYKKGDPVCQFLFQWLDKETDRPYNGKYQHQSKAAHAARYELSDGSNLFAAPPTSY